jgi:hypothetical protein
VTGLVAIVSHDPARPVPREELAALAASYEALRGPADRAVEGVGGRAAAVVLGPEQELREAVSREGEAWCAVAGHVLGPSPLDARLEDLDGQFGLVRFDGREAVVACDPFAMQAVYTAERDGKTYVSTSSLVLARHLRAAPSRHDFLAFLRAGYHFGTQTLWEGVVRLEPGAAVSIGDRGPERRIYWRPKRDEAVTRLDFDDAVSHAVETSVETYKRWLTPLSPTWADLTGGYDTRLLALLLREAGLELDTNTRGDDRGSDRRVAHRLAELANWRLLDLTVPENWSRELPRMLPLAVAWADGTLEVLELSWVLWAHERLAREQPRLLIGGGGEHLRGFAWRQEFLRGGRSTEVRFDNWLDMRMLHPMDVSLFAEDPTAAVRDDFDQRMRRWVEPYSSELNTTQLDVMYAYKVTGHFGTYRSADAAFLDARLPFYLKPVFDAAFSTSHRHRDGHRLMRHMIARLDPRIAAVTTSTGGPAEPRRATNIHRFLPYYTQLVQKAANKLSQRAFGRAVAPERARSWWAPAPARSAAIETLGSNRRPGELRLGPLLNEHEVEQLFEQASREDFRETTVLGRVLTAELALRAVDSGFER